MNTKEKLESALKDAMRARDDLRKRTLRMALSSIRLSEVEKRAPLDEPAVLAILQKEVKSRHETIADAQRANRPELAASAQEEITVLESFLPQPLTPEELEAMARQAIDEAGATSAREMGQVMKLLMPRIQGRASGDQVSQAVRKQLSV
jgi:uncharacterized protein YqeY